MKNNFVFFGSDDFSRTVLLELISSGFTPSLIVTAPPKPSGRGMRFQEPPIKIFADENNIPTLQPEKLDEDFINALQSSEINYDFFVVASYGKIIPKKVIDLPKKGVLNVHPSLLPLYRGASPIESQILNSEEHVGVSIMIMDELMDHGPILSQKVVGVETLTDRKYQSLALLLAKEGGRELSRVIPLWMNRTLEAKPQDHNIATFTKKIKKEDGEIKLEDNALENYLKFLAFSSWPETYFFVKNKGGKEIRVKIKDAKLVDNKFTPLRVTPEGGKEMNYEDFVRGLGR